MTKIKEMLKQSGLDWHVNVEEIQTKSGIDIPAEVAMIRTDTKTCLGVHCAGYVPYQNEELLELLFKITKQTGLELHTGGSFKGGKKVYFQLKSDELKLGNDTVKGYISGFNSFDGRGSLGFGNSNVTVSCMNTFYLGYRSVETKLRHSGSMKPNIEKILRNIDLLLKEEKDAFQTIERMAGVKLDDNVKSLVIQKLFDISREEYLAPEELSTNKKNKLEQFNRDMETELGSKGDNIWGMFSSMTRYTTHSMKKGEDNTDSKIFGSTGVKERKIWHDLSILV